MISEMLSLLQHCKTRLTQCHHLPGRLRCLQWLTPAGHRRPNCISYNASSCTLHQAPLNFEEIQLARAIHFRDPCLAPVQRQSYAMTRDARVHGHNDMKMQVRKQQPPSTITSSSAATTMNQTRATLEPPDTIKDSHAPTTRTSRFLPKSRSKQHLKDSGGDDAIHEEGTLFHTIMLGLYY